MMRNSDTDYFAYFPASERDRQWGLYVSGVGSTHVPPFARNYPLRVHPTDYMYAWKTGRVLHEYQVLYIARGEGTFESKQGGTCTVPAGSVMLVFPGEWHRYRPRKESGWDECWVSFGGDYVDHLVQQGFFLPENPVLHTGVDEAIQHAYRDLMDRARHEPVGYQQLNAASVHEILAAVLAAMRRQRDGSGHSAEIVRRAKALLEEKVEGRVSIARLAGSLSMSAEHLRRLFREHLGMSPHQYYLQLKVHRARQLLHETTLTVKQIALRLGFESPFHFSKAFKQRTGTSPTQWRRGE
jgi:AraC-like DNA-binding protein